MFHVKTKLKESRIHGIGLFADQDIIKGSKIYSISEDLDLFLTDNALLDLSEDEIRTIKHYGYFDKEKSVWHLAFDDIRYCNHEKNANMILSTNCLIAKRDIKKGEELTQDYSEFEELRPELIN